MVNTFNINNIKERLATIAKITFPKSLVNLEYFINIASYNK